VEGEKQGVRDKRLDKRKRNKEESEGGGEGGREGGRAYLDLHVLSLNVSRVALEEEGSDGKKSVINAV